MRYRVSRLLVQHLTVCALNHVCFTLATSCECGGTLRASSATLKSPLYPDQYPPNCDCQWDVSVDRVVTDIRVKFKEFDLQPMNKDGNCVDYVGVYRGSTPSTLGKYCGESVPPVLNVKGSSVTIRFLSDGQHQGTGFVIVYEAISDDATVSQATAGIVAAVFCAVVFIGVGALRCILKGSAGSQENQQREERVEPPNGEYDMDCPPTYRSVMEHPERYPTPTLSRRGTPEGTPLSRRTHSHLSHDSSAFVDSSHEDDQEPPPPYPGVIIQVDNELNRPYLGEREVEGSVEPSRDGTNLVNGSIEGPGGTFSNGQSTFESASSAGTDTVDENLYELSAVQTVRPCVESDETLQGHTV